MIEQTQGQVYAYNQANQRVAYENVLDQSSLLQQDSVIFDASVKENVGVYQTFADDDIVAAMQKAGLEKWLDRNQFQITLPIGQANLSGGEKRRLDLARTLLFDKDIVVFDELTTGLDAKNSAWVEQEVQNLTDKMVIYITHHYSPEFMATFDAVIEVKHGQVLYRDI